MSEEDAERLLRGAFDEQARAYVDDQRVPPPPRFAHLESTATRRRAHRLAPFAAAAAVIAVVGGVTLGLVAAGNHSGPDRTLALPRHSPSRTAAASGIPPIGAHAVRIRAATPGGRTYGVGIPVVAYFSRRFPSAKELNAATTVTANGVRVPVSWYFERSPADSSYPVEGHLRPREFWPAHAQVTVTVPARGLPAGSGYTFADGMHLSFRTGPRQIALVDDRSHRLTLSRDGRVIASYPVSLGGPQTPTMRGTKVVMAKGTPLCLSGPGYHECNIRYTQRLSYSGEYLISAPWNAANIERGVDTSSGCTNLMPADARHLYRVMRVGDVVEYPNSKGPAMTPQLGFGDWDVPWRVWRGGGLIPTH
ncbi:MAG TPA: L,D-transpeptidase [Jatrophihabitans sp.]|nr:L,D-transpeptidase [Jatrophihabitans sp.]